MPIGVDVIIAAVKTLPSSPGVYRMLDCEGTILYVGKARSLKKRVTNYTRVDKQSARIARMIMQTASMEFVHTETETEALLLEANMIKSFRPRYNILLRDDKSFPYILIAEDHPSPQILKHRGARKRKGQYFGPFASASAVNKTINALQRAFLIRSCSDSVYEGRSRPCLLYQIKRCAGPCTDEITREDYQLLVKESYDFLRGKSDNLKESLRERMVEASDRLDFETAAKYRDRLGAVNAIQSQQDINARSFSDGDIFACFKSGGQSCIQVFFFRMGQNWGNRAYYPKADSGDSEAAILGAFIGQFYDDKPAPANVILSHSIEEQALLSEALTMRMQHKVQISTPQRGEKKEIVLHALRNAEEALIRKLSENKSTQKLLADLANLFELDAPPKRIEVYDNSHIQGNAAVGGMVVAGANGFLKGHYRKFNIKDTDLTPGDDFGMMKEVLSRRLSRLIKEYGDNTGALSPKDQEPIWPDLLLIDGGKGQLSAVQEIFDELGIDNIALVAISKGPDRNAGREQFHITGKEAQMLPLNDPTLHYLQRLRDEAHRFAIGTHRAKRSKNLIKSPLDEIEGIGPTRKKALLSEFGTAKAVKQAGLDDLKRTPGISEEIAQRIYDYFHE